MVKRTLLIVVLILSAFLYAGAEVAGSDEASEVEFSLQETIFSHLGDAYYGELPGGVHIYLPVIVKERSGGWHCFSARRLFETESFRGFYIAAEGKYAGKIVAKDGEGQVYRPWDLSITKNVVSLFCSALLTLWIVFALRNYYRKNGLKAPRKGMGMMEVLLDMLYKEIIVQVLGKEAKRFAPYLLTLFFFIFISNLLGMVAFFPGGANVTGNIAVTMVLALCTFVVINVSGTKAYWKEILWPDVPVGLKFPIPLMPVIELFGMFTKPIALMVRLFANMLGGHLVSLVLVVMIFLVGSMGAAVQGATTVISVVFSLFMSVLHLLVAFIQAYVFMMLSTIFIGLAKQE